MYLQGASSSLPEDVQNAFYRSIKGFENIEILRPAYAIEYDCVDPTSLEATLESKIVRGLYGAGQFNGTSGYEEAAAQGLLAGLNAARNAQGREQLILPRHTSYLGTLVDDLVTKGVMDPYRMMTSRSEYRLTLRQDNADTRLTPIGREYGLVQDDRWAKYEATQAALDAERRRLHEAHVKTAELRQAMEAAGLTPAEQGGLAEELLRRPEIHYELLAGLIGWGEGITPMLAERVETEIKYAGYIARQDRMIREVARHEKTEIPADFRYEELTGLTLEAREKLARIRPRNLGQAGRIPGVSPSDAAQLSIALAAAQRAAPQAAQTAQTTQATQTEGEKSDDR
jgi:tRNA uridine 5-carboxymethylaminomethyl modification enzyme